MKLSAPPSPKYRPLPWRWHVRSTLNLAVPVIAGQIGHIITMFFDTVMVGRVGTADLAAAALSNALFFTFIVFGFGLTMGITPLVAIAEGEKKQDELPGHLRHGVLLSIFFSVAVASVLLFAAPAIHLLGQEKSVASLAVPYFRVVVISMVPMFIFLPLKQFAEGLSMTRDAMWVSIGGNALNIVLNYLLIYGKLGLPAYGLMGAGYATLISRALMALALIIIYSRRARLREFMWVATRLKTSWDGLKKVFRIGAPIGTQMFFEVTSFSAAAIMVGWLGAAQQAAHSLVLNLATITYIVASGIGSAATVKVGNRLGERNFVELRRAAKTCNALAFVWMGAASVLFLVARYPLVGVYTVDPVVIGFAAYSMFFAAAFQVFDGLQAVALGALRGIKEVRVPTMFTMVAYWGLSLPTSYLLAFVADFGLSGIWMGFIVGLGVSAGLNQWWFHRKAKQLSARSPLHSQFAKPEPTLVS